MTKVNPRGMPESEWKNEVRMAARRMYAAGSDNDIEVDDDAEVHENNEGGAWVQGWLYVRDDDWE